MKAKPEQFIYSDYYLAASIPTDDEATALSKDLDLKNLKKPNKLTRRPNGILINTWKVCLFVNNDKSTVNWVCFTLCGCTTTMCKALNEWKGGPTTDICRY